jgi:hypothetical protein
MVKILEVAEVLYPTEEIDIIVPEVVTVTKVVSLQVVDVGSIVETISMVLVTGSTQRDVPLQV